MDFRGLEKLTIKENLLGPELSLSMGRITYFYKYWYILIFYIWKKGIHSEIKKKQTCKLNILNSEIEGLKSEKTQVIVDIPEMNDSGKI